MKQNFMTTKLVVKLHLALPNQFKLIQIKSLQNK